MARDSVVVDAKRILLRYGTPIRILGRIPKEKRVVLARELARTELHEREERVRELLVEAGYLKAE